MAGNVCYDWETIRAEYEAGASMGALEKKYGVSRQAISKRKIAGGWEQDAVKAVNRRALEKADGLVDSLVDSVNPKKRAEAVNRAAEQKAAVIERHREEWDKHKAFMDEVQECGEDLDNAFAKAKLAKITAETLKIRQEGERKAWGIYDKAEMEVSGGLELTWQK